MVKLFLTPFANSGDKTEIPATIQVDGSVSYPEGWGADYSKDPTSDPLAKNIPRNETNQLYFDITEAIKAYQTEGVPPFITSAENGGSPYSYGAGAMVRYDDGGGFLAYVSLVDANVDLPTVAASWVPVGSSSGGGGVSGSSSGLVISTTGTSAPVSVSADEVVLSSDDVSQVFSAISVTASLDVAGAGGLDTGASTVSTWYAVWLIAKDDGTVSGLLSLSETSPTMPVDYTFKARVGWVRSDATANKYPLRILQCGRRVSYATAAGSNTTNLPIAASGVQGSTTTPTWISVGIDNFVPPSARTIGTIAGTGGNGNISMVAPNSGYGTYTSTTNPPRLSYFGHGEYWFNLESRNIFVAMGTSACRMLISGWEE